MFVFMIVAAALTTGFFIYKQPDTVISFIKRISPQKVEQPINMKGIGILGDSQSDEYRADDARGDNYPSTTLNWVEILAQERKLNFGEWGIWEEPRRSGFSYNWSRSGATAASLIESGQHLGLAEQVKKGQVNIAVIYIGANDFAPHITADGYQAIYNEELTDAQIERKINRLVAEIETAVDVVSKAGKVKIFLVKIPDWSNHIGVKLAFPFPHKRILVTRAVNETNDKLEAMAGKRDIITIDPNQFYREMVTKDSTGKPLIGKVHLEWLYLNNDPKNVFLNDGIHIGTAMNGLFANYLINSMNPYLQNPIIPLSDQEILDVSGLK